MKLANIYLLISLNQNLVHSYNYYMLALQNWCSDEYMIHGLWPQETSSEYPEYCENVIYNEPNGDLLNEMNDYWDSCSKEELWKHEWTKHGSCMSKQYNITENYYYNKTISLFKNNRDRLIYCNDSDCILGCFDLNYNMIKCE